MKPCVLIIRTTFDLSFDRERQVSVRRCRDPGLWLASRCGLKHMRDARWQEVERQGCRADKGGRHSGNLLFFEQIMFFLNVCSERYSA